MISSGEDRLQILWENYHDADSNEGNDLSKAVTPVLVRAVQSNWSAARDAYYTKVASELAATTEEAEAAYQNAQAAVSAVKTARRNSAQIADLIKKMQNATGAANALVTAASS